MVCLFSLLHIIQFDDSTIYPFFNVGCIQFCPLHSSATKNILVCDLMDMCAFLGYILRGEISGCLGLPNSTSGASVKVFLLSGWTSTFLLAGFGNPRYSTSLPAVSLYQSLVLGILWCLQ